MLDVLADAHELPREPELLLDGLEGRDRGWQSVGAVQVPGIEAGEVLDGPQDLVAAHGGGDVF